MVRGALPVKVRLPDVPSTTQNRWRTSMETLVSAYTLISAITSAKAELWEKAQPLSLLRETDFAHQFGVTRIGAQGIEREFGPVAIQQVAVFLVCGVDPLEGVMLVAQFGI